MIDGTCCQYCGQYFVDPKNDNHLYTHGFPVVCKDCYDGMSKEERRQYKCAKVSTI